MQYSHLFDYRAFPGFTGPWKQKEERYESEGIKSRTKLQTKISRMWIHLKPVDYGLKTLDTGSVEDTGLGILGSWWRMLKMKWKRYNIDAKDFPHKLFQFWSFVSPHPLNTVRYSRETIPNSATPSFPFSIVRYRKAISQLHICSKSWYLRNIAVPL